MKKAISTTGTIVFKFDGLADLEFDATKVAPAMRARAEQHGWLARLGDAAAIPRTQPDGTVVTVTEQMRRDAVAELVTHYESGSVAWETKRASAPSPAIAALAAKKGWTYAEAEKFVADMLAGV